MTLYYSPFFTGECYRNYPVGQACLEKVVGDAGLLDFLELRLGLPGGEAGAIDRILAYEAALKSALTGAFYEDAFEKDSLATAKEILRWRDTLVMEGFDAHVSYESSRLRTLAQVEKVFGASGTPERWKKVRESAKGPLAGVEIIVCHDMDLLPKLIRETLKALGVEKGRYDGLGEDDLPFDAKGKKISIRPFGTVSEAFRWAADDHSCEVVICPEPFRMNAVLRNREKPLLAASADGDSSILQLFRLGLLLLERPLDVGNLLEFLRIGHSPIPAETRYALAFALRRDGGMGKAWKQVPLEDEGKTAVETYLEPLLKVQGGTVPKQVVVDWCEAVAKWAPSQIYEGNKLYVAELIDLCRGMCRVLGSVASDPVDVSFVLKTLKTVYEPKPVASVRAEAGSWNAVDSHRCLIDAPKSLLWLPCNGGLGTAYPYDFLLQEEIEELELKEPSPYIRYDFNLMLKKLGEVGEQIVLCTCDYDCGEALAEHPAVTVCKALTTVGPPPAASGVVPSVFKPLRTLEMPGVDLFPKKKKAAGEPPEDVDLSATSIDTLIAFPFDYVMARTLGFQDLSSLQLPDLTLTEGNVAHYVFERMLKDGDRTTGSMRAMLGDDFGKRVDAAAEEKGGILFRPENRTLFLHFKETLRNSIRVLLDILDRHGLRPLDSEVTLKQNLEGISQITGSVDFCAERPNHDLVVIDFKYSKGKNYIDKLDQNTSIQLELYAHALKDKLGHPVVAKGYYFFPINQLHTDDDTGVFRAGQGVFLHEKEEKEFSLYDRIDKSVNFRKAQLKEGTLEMEEGAPLEEIDYHRQAADGSLLDIPADKKDKTVKASSPFSDPTKYPILKNALK